MTPRILPSSFLDAFTWQYIEQSIDQQLRSEQAGMTE
jgi:hypothetical protein